MSFASSKLLWVAGVCMIVLVLAVHVVTIDRQPTWEDEIFAVSTGWSMANGQPASLSVLAPFPRTISPIKFYGPVSFVAEAWLIRTFGLSVTVWRLACFGGVILTLLISIALVRLAGGDRSAQLITALIIALAGSTASQQPGRWDFVTVGLFLSGLFLLLQTVKIGGPFWKIPLAGACVGIALASTPRALPLCFAAGVSLFLTALWFGRLRKRLLLWTLTMFAAAVVVQTLLLLPWGLNTFSWYVFVKKATSQNNISATPMTGEGAWNLDLNLDKAAFAVLVLLLGVAICNVILRIRSTIDAERIPYKLFLTLFCFINLLLMMLLFVHALGQTAFWFSPTAAALMSWWDWDFLSDKRRRTIAASLIGLSLCVLLIQEAQRVALIFLTWHQTSISSLTAFVGRAVPKGAVLFGPVGAYFYPVELSGDHYFYPFENTTPGLYSNPPASPSKAVEAIVCEHPSYAIWPDYNQLNPKFVWRLPGVLANRLRPKIAEFHEPLLPGWKRKLLNRMGLREDGHRFPDVAIYPLRSLDICAEK